MNPITHVAIRFNGVVYSLPKPNRHHNVIWLIVEQTGVETVDAHGEDQGFLDSEGEYLTRKEALDNARFNDQLRDDRPIWNEELFSENLW
jgi:hypothetical protein